jgi:hypothetical protein
LTSANILVKKNHYAEVEGDPNELDYKIRLEMAYNDFLDHNGDKSIRRVAAEHGLESWETLRDRINGVKPKAIEAELRQRLSKREEAVIQRHIQRLEVWGWPPIVHQV